MSDEEQTETTQQPQDPAIIGAWVKSSFSGGNGGSCVLVAVTENNGRAVKHSQDNSEEPKILYFSDLEWSAFLRGVAEGEFGAIS